MAIPSFPRPSWPRPSWPRRSSGSCGTAGGSGGATPTRRRGPPAPPSTPELAPKVTASGSFHVRDWRFHTTVLTQNAGPQRGSVNARPRAHGQEVQGVEARVVVRVLEEEVCPRRARGHHQRGVHGGSSAARCCRRRACRGHRGGYRRCHCHRHRRRRCHAGKHGAVAFVIIHAAASPTQPLRCA